MAKTQGEGGRSGKPVHGHGRLGPAKNKLRDVIQNHPVKSKGHRPKNSTPASRNAALERDMRRSKSNPKGEFRR